MDNHIGDWLYYIVILVVAGISWLSSVNKKKQQEAQQSASSLPEEPSAPPVRQQRTKKTPPPIPKHLQPRASSYSFMATNEGEHAMQQTSILTEEESGPSISDTLELTHPETFRKAIIYAGIMNRKY